MSNMIALVSLDFGGQEACVASAEELTPMDPHLVEATIKAYLTEIRNRLDRAAGIGRAAERVEALDFDLDFVMGSSEVMRRHPPHHLSPARAKPRQGKTQKRAFATSKVTTATLRSTQ